MGDSISFEQIIDWIIHNIVQILFILSVFIQITPIKVNPWSALFKWIGKLINTEPNDKIDQLVATTDQLKKDLKAVQSDIDANEKDRIRWEVLDFANSCRNGRKHTQDEFKHIIELNDKYEALLKKTEDKNGVFVEEYKYIEKLYEERQIKNDFL